MKEATATSNPETARSRRALLTSLAAAAVLSGCKSTPEPAPTSNAGGPESKTVPVDDKPTRASKAALALWLIFTTRKEFATISYSAGKPSISVPPKLLNSLETDLSGLLADPKDTIKAFIDALQAKDIYAQKFTVPNPAGGSVKLPYAIALQAVQELFQKFGQSKLVGMENVKPPYTPGECCPKHINNILALVTNKPATIDDDYTTCT